SEPDLRSGAGLDAAALLSREPWRCHVATSGVFADYALLLYHGHQPELRLQSPAERTMETGGSGDPAALRKCPHDAGRTGGLRSGQTEISAVREHLCDRR